MKLSGSDFPLLRRSILAVCVSALASAAILYSSNQYAESAQKEQRRAQGMLNDARNRLTAALQDRENMDIYANEYGSLIGQKVVGDDQRLDWMEGLENIRRKDLVADFRYSIAPQKAYVPPQPVDGGNFDIRYSEMKLQFDLLHEKQLLDFFDELRSIKGRYQLEGCTMKRLGAGNEGEKASALKTECSGGWITLKNRNAPQ